MTEDDPLIGTGFQFPIKVNAKGGLDWSSGPGRIRDAIWIILSTAPGERVMRPTFGAGAESFVFEPNSVALQVRMAETIKDALTQWEPRIELVDVAVAQGSLRELGAGVDQVPDPQHQRAVQHGLPVLCAGRTGLMPLPDIQLDDRTFEQLVTELRRRIPAYTPEWTDHNDSDPGITLLQLFAWLSEMIIWRLNQVPQKNYYAFLRLVGIDLIERAGRRGADV